MPECPLTGSTNSGIWIGRRSPVAVVFVPFAGGTDREGLVLVWDSAAESTAANGFKRGARSALPKEILTRRLGASFSGNLKFVRLFLRFTIFNFRSVPLRAIRIAFHTFRVLPDSQAILCEYSVRPSEGLSTNLSAFAINEFRSIEWGAFSVPC